MLSRQSTSPNPVNKHLPHTPPQSLRSSTMSQELAAAFLPILVSTVEALPLQGRNCLLQLLEQVHCVGNAQPQHGPHEMQEREETMARQRINREIFRLLAINNGLDPRLLVAEQQQRNSHSGHSTADPDLATSSPRSRPQTPSEQPVQPVQQANQQSGLNELTRTVFQLLGIQPQQEQSSRSNPPIHPPNQQNDLNEWVTSLFQLAATQSRQEQRLVPPSQPRPQQQPQQQPQPQEEHVLRQESEHPEPQPRQQPQTATAQQDLAQQQGTEADDEADDDADDSDASSSANYQSSNSDSAHYVSSNSDTTITNASGDPTQAAASTSATSSANGSQNDRHINGHSLTNIETPGPNDVLMGRGSGSANHEGNIKFRALVERHKPRYVAASRSNKPYVAGEVVALWRELEPPGRFLERCYGGATNWNDVGDKRARQKTSQCLREKERGNRTCAGKRKRTETF